MSRIEDLYRAGLSLKNATEDATPADPEAPTAPEAPADPRVSASIKGGAGGAVIGGMLGALLARRERMLAGAGIGAVVGGGVGAGAGYGYPAAKAKAQEVLKNRAQSKQTPESAGN